RHDRHRLRRPVGSAGVLDPGRAHRGELLDLDLRPGQPDRPVADGVPHRLALTDRASATKGPAPKGPAPSAWRRRRRAPGAAAPAGSAQSTWARVPRYSSMTLGSLSRARPVSV